MANTADQDVLEQMQRDRDAALLSLDKATIVAYLTQYGEAVHPDERIFWAGVHKARTACTTLPLAARLTSKFWLREHGFRSEDDGELGARSR